MLEQDSEVKVARHLFLIVILVFVFLSIGACIITGGGGGGDGTEGSSAAGSISGDDATATYGAEQFHLQLTAISRDPMTPAAGAP